MFTRTSLPSLFFFTRPKSGVVGSVSPQHIVCVEVGIMDSQKRYGMRKEEQVAQFLSQRGATVGLSPGSLGLADLIARWPNGHTWHVQVKASRIGHPACLTRSSWGNYGEAPRVPGPSQSWRRSRATALPSWMRAVRSLRTPAEINP